MMCMALILVCSVSISTFAVDRMSQVESGTTQSVQKTDNQNGETATTRQKSSEAETKTKQENAKKSDSESKTKENKDSSEEKQSDSKDVNDKGAKENSTQKEEKEEKEKKEKSEKDTSKEEKYTKEETDADKKTTDTTDTSEATTKTVEEKKTESAEEKTTEAATEKTTESKDSEEETSEKKAEEETQAVDAKRQKIQVAEITESKKVQVGEPLILNGRSGYYISNHKWTSSNTNIATVTGDGSTATVTGVAVGDATITHTYSYRWNTQTETYKVTVTKFEDNHNGDAAIYYLANPAGDPWTNDTGAWAPSKESSETIAQINTKGATWEDGYVGSEIYNNKNIKSNVARYITSWPDSSTGGTWTVKKNDSATGKYFNFILISIWDNYKSSVAKELKINENDLKKENITEITLIPRKISRANGGDHEYHIDCALSIKSKQVFTAKFWVKEPGASEYTQVDSKNYTIESSVVKTTKAEIGFTKTVDGVTYVLDGWYPENADGGAYDSTKKIADTSWDYKPKDTELADGTVNFYAHYSPRATSITIKKLVTGNMGDKQKEFAFTCTYSSYNAITKKTETKTASFNLKDGQSSTEIKNVYIGSQFTVKETNAQGYTTSGSYNNADISSVEHGTDKESSEKIAEVQIAEDGKNITIINNKEAIPDTGIVSDVLPFITLFALSIAGIIGFLLYSYKKRFV